MSLIVEKAQELILACKSKKTAVDATCGNGHDTLFLLEHFSEVFAFDIQPLAIKRTKAKTEGYRNLHLYKEDFRKINQYLKGADAIMFNLGFLPGSDKKIKTSANESAEAIISAFQILNEGGIMTVACYTEHEGGRDEFLKIKAALESLQIPFKMYEGFANNEVLIEIRK
ncbi:MAG TPA: class I SAM-dependent methyltransferase [Bacilli bacterium]